MPKKTKPQGDIPYVVPGSVDPDAYEATPIEQKRARRQWAKQNQEYILQELARGRSLEDLGIRDVKEMGRSMYRMLAQRGEQGFQDPNWTYDWNSGMKMNHATSDVNARNRWIPIEPNEYAERDAQQAFGTGPDAWIRRLQADSQNQLNTWAQQNAVKGGVLRRDEHGLYMTGDAGERYDFDNFGNLIDANTGQIIGDQYGMGTDLLSQGRGYKSPWGTTAAIPGTGHPDSPTATSGPTTHPALPSPTGTPVNTARQKPVTPFYASPTANRSAWGNGGVSARPTNPLRLNPQPQQPMQPTVRMQPQTVMQRPQRRTAYGSYGIFQK